MSAMVVVHAVLDAARDIHLWAEDPAVDPDVRAPTERAIASESGGSRHPFAAPSVVIETVAGQVSEYRLGEPGLAVTLPTGAGAPLASGVVLAGGDDRDVTWTEWRVPTVCLETAEALRLLLSLPERPDARLGSSIRFFARVAL